jgi:hypothetical protein
MVDRATEFGLLASALSDRPAKMVPTMRVSVTSGHDGQRRRQGADWYRLEIATHPRRTERLQSVHTPAE